MPKVVGASKVTARFQVTVPEEVRKVLKIEIGQTLVFIHNKSDKRVEILAEV